MSVPKSVVKFKRDNVELISNIDYTQYTIVELTRAAMRDVGKYLARQCNTEAKKLPGLKKNRRVFGRTSTFLYNVPWAKDGDLPHLEMGITDDTWYGVEQELGTSNQPKRQILRGTVLKHLDKIKEIEGVYLSAINDGRADELIDEKEYSGGADNE